MRKRERARTHAKGPLSAPLVAAHCGSAREPFVPPHTPTLRRYEFFNYSPVLQSSMRFETEYDWGGTRIVVTTAEVENLRVSGCAELGLAAGGAP